MARILPWATGDAAATKSSKPRATRRATPRESRESSTPTAESKTKGQASSEISSSPARPVRKKRTQSRSPSTSPPPGPPSVRFMSEGYDADDIYIMVEDEFQTVAHSFTTHIHHAEYKRQQKKAREAPANATPQLLDGMSRGTRQQLAAKMLSDKQRIAVSEMTSKAQIKRSEDDEDQEQPIDEPWSGTHLAELMAGSSTRGTALVGLESISSSTRAARGFSRTESHSPEKGKRSVADFFGGNKAKVPHKVQDNEPNLKDEDGAYGDNDSDLDLPPIPKSKPWKQTNGKLSRDDRLEDLDDVRPTKARLNGHGSYETAARNPTAELSSAFGSKTRPTSSVLDDSFDRVDEILARDTKSRMRPQSLLDPFKKKWLEREKEKKKKASEIPIFLV